MVIYWERGCSAHLSELLGVKHLPEMNIQAHQIVFSTVIRVLLKKQTGGKRKWVWL